MSDRLLTRYWAALTGHRPRPPRLPMAALLAAGNRYPAEREVPR